MLKYKTFKYSLFLASLLLLTVSNLYGAPRDDNKVEKGLQKDSGNPVSESQEVERSYIYDPAGRTDPFMSFISVREEKEKSEKPRTYLETLELSQVILTAIVISKEGKWAMVKDSKDLGHVIREGTLIGTNGGVVHQIRAGEVIIRERFKDFRGNDQYRDISKKTPSPQ